MQSGRARVRTVYVHGIDDNMDERCAIEMLLFWKIAGRLYWECVARTGASAVHNRWRWRGGAEQVAAVNASASAMRVTCVTAYAASSAARYGR